MMKHFFFYTLFLFSLQTIVAQKVPTSKYVDIHSIGNIVYAESTTGKLVVWDLKKDNVSYIKKDIQCIGVSNNKTAYCVTSEGNILEEKDVNQWNELGSVQGKAYSIHFTSKNKPIVISSKGLYFNKKYSLPNKSNRIGNYETALNKRSLDQPDLSYVDDQDRVWISYDLGHYNDLYIFDTKKGLFIREKVLYVKDDKKHVEWEKYIKEYRNKQLKKYPFYVKKEGSNFLYKLPTELPIYYGIKSIVQDKNGSFFFSQNLNSSDIKSGLYSYEKTATPSFYLPKENLDKYVREENEIMGPMAYNTFNNALYYYSNLGFFKLKKSGGSYTKELIIDPNILLYNHLIEHIKGHLMKVKKFEFLDENRFIFLTHRYGFGYYDGEELNIFN